ncbi:hypothetical protein BDV38DRAFT_286631 [Aspergillus pseudotamarii]|uniref:Cytochrome P450 n=1 Tax=Aspergillus pseudotamarii TaxID=132259 RepID=A0A5N6SIU2_ASPPS|nr:uncharacterized protein BDV38DRAFT_286631 [Aspergillus pseudotamarii]KAE8133591.1 hypothetical protein BDV38DRAFT_286631 [Aspergillus pseudotamarii]
MAPPVELLISPWITFIVPVFISLYYLVPWFWILNHLRDIPGAFSGQLSNLWLLLACRAGKRYSYVDEAHKRYGPIVRIQPNHMSIANEEVIQLKSLPYWLVNVWGRGVIHFTPPVLSTVYFVNGTTLRPRPFHVTENQANGVAFSQDRNGKGGVFTSPRGCVPGQEPPRIPYRLRTLDAYGVSYPGAWTSVPRPVSVLISFVYDGVKSTRSAWVFAFAGEGVDVLDSQTGLALGTIRVVGGGDYVAVNMALGQNKLWIIGAGWSGM